MKQLEYNVVNWMEVICLYSFNHCVCNYVKCCRIVLNKFNQSAVSSKRYLVSHNEG